jgi:hypothetical protein
MLRKILYAAVASVSLLAPLAVSTPVAEAREIHRRADFRVYSRSCGAERWRCTGTYSCRSDAVRAMHRLQHRGYQAYCR